MKRSKNSGREEIKVELSTEVVAVLDDYARCLGVSRSEALRAALYSVPRVARAVTHVPVASRDVLGP